MGVRTGLDLPKGGHGVEYASAQHCTKDNGKKCAACKAVCAAYQRERRRQDIPSVTREKQRNYARQRALTRLGRKYRAELEELIAEELAKGEVDNGG